MRSGEHKEKEKESYAMKNRQSMILYAMESIPRPGSRETRVRAHPGLYPIRNRGGNLNESR